MIQGAVYLAQSRLFECEDAGLDLDSRLLYRSGLVSSDLFNHCCLPEML